VKINATLHKISALPSYRLPNQMSGHTLVKIVVAFKAEAEAHSSPTMLPHLK
jgi:hypothetical protein